MMKISTQFGCRFGRCQRFEQPLLISACPCVPTMLSEFAQWFYFRLQGAAYQNCVMHFENAADAAYPLLGKIIRFALYDRQNWFRVPTSYENGVLTINHTPLSNSVYYAYFEPYSNEQHLNLLGDAQGSGLVPYRRLGSTVRRPRHQSSDHRQPSRKRHESLDYRPSASG